METNIFCRYLVVPAVVVGQTWAVSLAVAVVVAEFWSQRLAKSIYLDECSQVEAMAFSVTTVVPQQR